MKAASVVPLLVASVALALGVATAQQAVAARDTTVRVPVPLIPRAAEAPRVPRAPRVPKTSGAQRRSSASKCNGYSELCDRKLNLVAFPTTHNSFASGDNIAANQNKGIPDQLDDGIRGFMLDLHNASSSTLFRRASASEPYLCHTSCVLLNDGPLSDTLKYFTTFLEAHSEEVISIFLENDDNFSATTIAQAFEDAGLDKFVYTPSGSSTNYTWPTLGEMVEKNTRLVVLVDRNSDTKSVPWLVYDRNYAVQTPYTVGVGSTFGCSLMTDAQPLLVMNHFVYTNYSVLSMEVEKPSPDTASSVNTRQSIVDQANVCGAAARFPNFITVDFYDVGDLFKAVADINKVQYSSPSVSTDFSSAASDSHTTSAASLSAATGSTAVLAIAVSALALLL
ncbi:hypothetical protein GGI11_004697 [Coemansia sp. RSA 2049]|nr:hypothetical protein GGI11_004697 [Coemansia sp. RSA 2049]KAJ2517967.1 hypothetical protein H4217_003628 [Coemansia sp. RSA 1939]KAJ2609205.1 hypothetical protein EV177_004580 [Coemansia sp. RSA 1804]KAJ2684864.1 hypothetical protein GGH99_003915 [Coemansia sp. RSA 1285]